MPSPARGSAMPSDASAARPGVFVVGSLNFDTVLRVPHHPLPGETVAGRDRAQGVGGKGGNQAIAASRAGADVVMVGAVGTDPDGVAIIADLVDAGVDTTGVARHPGPSGAATVLVADDGENVIVISAGANAAIAADAIDAGLAELRPGDVVVLQNEVPAAATAHAAARGRAAGATVLWNAAPAPTSRDDIPADVDVLVVNEGELAAVAALLGLDGSAELDATIAVVGAQLGADVVCTRGADGALALLDGTLHEVEAPRVSPVDTTAAGDTFVGYFAASSALPVAERLRLAATAGAVAVTRHGAAASIPRRADVSALLPV